MMHGLIRTAVAALLGVSLIAQDPQQQQPQRPFDPFDRAAFESYARDAGAGDERMAAFAGDVEELGMAIAVDDLMRDLHPAFGRAVDLSEEGDPRAALELTKVLSSTGDRRLAGHVRYHLARVFLDGDDPERAVRVLDTFLAENNSITPLDDEALYFYATALAEIPRTKEAIEIFNAYLHWFPDAPERFRATAHQRMQELLSQVDSPLHELADDMKKLARDIRKSRTGDPTQRKQEEIIATLQKLIEEMEQQENQSGGAPSGNQQPSGPADSSQLPPGKARMGNLRNVEGVADRWGDMDERDRKEIEADLNSSLPAHYKKMLEEYYKKLGKGQ